MADAWWLTFALALPSAAIVALAFAARQSIRLAHAAGITAAAGVIGAMVLLIGSAFSPAAPPFLFTASWIPSLDVSFSLVGDRLSLFFAGAALAVGALVAWYAVPYFRRESQPPLGRFFASLAFFQAAMVGAVLADNLLLFYGFWELTGVASFLLIGSHHEDAAARRAARQALLVTFITGLALFVGLLLLAQITQSFRWTEIVTNVEAWRDDPRVPVAATLLLIGALGKSAQVPFHFWLPNAMTAPTPVSTYLHSATMVMLGVYLAARLHPMLQGWPLALTCLLTLGWTSMLVGGVLALLAKDIKAMLAYSTISTLGYLLGLQGVHAEGIQQLNVVHFADHVLHKGCLFMIAGVVIHEAGARQVGKIGRLARRTPWLAAIAAVALADMAGVPGTIGFVSKEEVTRAIFELDGFGLLLVVFVVGSVLKVLFALRFFEVAFLGDSPRRSQPAGNPTLGGFAAPALVLALTIVLLGLGPQIFSAVFAAIPTLGFESVGEHHLTAFPGFTREFGVTITTLALGVLIHAGARSRRLYQFIIPPALEWERAHERLLAGLETGSRALARALQVDRPASFLPWTIGTLAVGGFAALLIPEASVTKRILSGFPAPSLHWWIGGMIVAAALGVVLLRLWTTQLIALSLAGFLICIYYALFRAPDLAITQILVEALSLFLFVLLLARFPKGAERGEQEDRTARHRWMRPTLATMCGLGTTIGLLLLGRPLATERVGFRQLEASVTAAKAPNAVNAVVTDFRALDTLGEGMVLIIALLASLGLLMRYRTQGRTEQVPASDPAEATR